MLYKHWLEGTDEKERGAAIAGLMAEKTALMEQRNKLRIEQTGANKAVTVAKIGAMATVEAANVAARTALITQAKMPDTPAAQAQIDQVNASMATAAKAQREGDIQGSSNALKAAAEAGTRLVNIAPGTGQSQMVATWMQGKGQEWDVLRTQLNLTGASDPGPLPWAGIQLQQADPSGGLNLDQFTDAPGGGLMVETATGGRGAPAQVGESMGRAPPARPGGGGGGMDRQVAAGVAALYQQTDPELAARFAEINAEIERLRQTRPGERVTPYDKLMPRQLPPRPARPPAIPPAPRPPTAERLTAMTDRPGQRAAEALLLQAAQSDAASFTGDGLSEDSSEVIRAREDEAAKRREEERQRASYRRLLELNEAKGTPVGEGGDRVEALAVQATEELDKLKALAPTPPARVAPPRQQRATFAPVPPPEVPFTLQRTADPAEVSSEELLRALEEEENETQQAAPARLTPAEEARIQNEQLGKTTKRKVGERYAAWARASGRGA
jgi:hypothetical protein